MGWLLTIQLGRKERLALTYGAMVLARVPSQVDCSKKMTVLQHSIVYHPTFELNRPRLMYIITAHLNSVASSIPWHVPCENNGPQMAAPLTVTVRDSAR